MDHFNIPTATTSATVTPFRSGTPDFEGRHQDAILPAQRAPVNPFQSPLDSRPASSTALNLHQQQQQQRYFHSRRVKKGEIERPWLDKKDPKEKWVTIIPLIGLAIGFAFAAFLIYDGLKTVITHEYCPVLLEDFSNGLDSNIWTKEAEVGGFG